MINYYKVCNLPPTATFNEIKKSLKSLQAQYEKEIHLGENVEALQSQLSIVIEAMEVLLDADTREAYDEELASTPNSDIKDPFADKYFDYGSIRASGLDKWNEVVDFDGEVNIETYRSLLRQSTVLPYPDIQENVVLAMMLTPSALATVVPIGFSFGGSGAGKSQISNLTTRIWGGMPLMGNATFATIRRYIAGMATAQHNGRIFCLNNALCWDDISPYLMRDANRFSLLKSGTSRATSLFLMPKSQTDTELVEQQIFGLRFISSIYPFFSDIEFIELNRRFMIIECKRSKLASEVLDFESIDWKGLSEATNNYWSKLAPEYAVHKKIVSKHPKKLRLISPERYALASDLMTTGLVTGIWGGITDAIDAVDAFFKSNDTLIELQDNPLKVVLTTCIEGKREYPANTLKGHVNDALKHGLIDKHIQRGELTQTMRSLGWELSVADKIWYKK